MKANTPEMPTSTLQRRRRRCRGRKWSRGAYSDPGRGASLDVEESASTERAFQAGGQRVRRPAGEKDTHQGTSCLPLEPED